MENIPTKKSPQSFHIRSTSKSEKGSPLLTKKVDQVLKIKNRPVPLHIIRNCNIANIEAKGVQLPQFWGCINPEDYPLDKRQTLAKLGSVKKSQSKKSYSTDRCQMLFTHYMKDRPIKMIVPIIRSEAQQNCLTPTKNDQKLQSNSISKKHHRSCSSNETQQSRKNFYSTQQTSELKHRIRVKCKAFNFFGRQNHCHHTQQKQSNHIQS